MKAVNLIPSEERRGGAAGGRSGGPAYALLGGLAVLVLMAAAWTLTGKTVNDRRSQLASVSQQANAAETQANKLAAYSTFSDLRKKRAETVASIARSRFDWAHVMHEIARVIPSDAHLTSLAGSVSPSAPAPPGGGTALQLRGSNPGPAIDVVGCIPGQSNVSLMLSRLRLIDGVEHVTLAESAKPDATVLPGSDSTGSAGCGRWRLPLQRQGREVRHPDHLRRSAGGRRSGRDGRARRWRHCHSRLPDDHDREHPVTSRDRLAAIVVGIVVLLAAFWFLGLSPKRKDAADLDAKISEAQQRLDAARQATTAGTAARDRYDADYATVAKLGKAVPADDDVLSLVYQLDHVSTGTHIDFRSIKLESSGAPAPAAATPAAQAAAVSQASGSDAKTTGATPPSGTSGTSTTAASTAGRDVRHRVHAFDGRSRHAVGCRRPAAGLRGRLGRVPDDAVLLRVRRQLLPYGDFFSGIQRFATVGSGDKLSVRGRLLTVDAFSLTASRMGFPAVKASINATAYLVPDSEGATAGATAQAPSDWRRARREHRLAGRARRCNIDHRRGAMSAVRSIFNDLVDRRLWPVAVALVAALVAIPVMLGGGSSASAPDAAAPLGSAATAAGGTAQAAISVSTPSTAPTDHPGTARNPFAQHKAPAAPAPPRRDRDTPAATGTPAVPARRRASGRRAAPSVTPIVPGSGGGRRDTVTDVWRVNLRFGERATRRCATTSRGSPRCRRPPTRSSSSWGSCPTTRPRSSWSPRMPPRPVTAPASRTRRSATRSR